MDDDAFYLALARDRVKLPAVLEATFQQHCGPLKPLEGTMSEADMLWYRAWLNTLKPGDEVRVSNRRMTLQDMGPGVVVARDASGIILHWGETGIRFDARTGEGPWGFPEHLVRPPAKTLEELVRNHSDSLLDGMELCTSASCTYPDAHYHPRDGSAVDGLTTVVVVG